MDIQNNNDTSPVKHTESGRIPDTSRLGSMSKRMKAAAPVIMDRSNLMMFGVPALLLGVGAFFYFSKNSKVRDFAVNKMNSMKNSGSSLLNSDKLDTDNWIPTQGDSKLSSGQSASV